MKLIPLTNGYSAKVNDRDYDWLLQWKWYAKVSDNNVYAARTITGEGGKRITIRMHRFIMKVTDPSVDIDHEDGDGLNNQRENLRPCTRQQNTMNSGSRKGAISKFKGVSWHHTKKRWFSQIGVSGKNKNLGYFDNEEDAARAYNTIARNLHGEYARYNEVEPIFMDKEWRLMVLLPRNTSGFRGVIRHKIDGIWRAQIRGRGNRVYLGLFTDPIEAAKAYDQAARELHGDSARLNFPTT